MADLVRASKFLCCVLRHNPEYIGLMIDPCGWADIDELIRLSSKYIALSHDLIEQTVAEDDKQRFMLNDEKTHIRANHGHSIKVDLGLQEMIPPLLLYHGTAERFVESIRKIGIRSQGRQYVHLSNDVATAESVGRRHGTPFVFEVFADLMRADGFKFYQSPSGVWLTSDVPVAYIVN